MPHRCFSPSDVVNILRGALYSEISDAAFRELSARILEHVEGPSSDARPSLPTAMSARESPPHTPTHAQDLPPNTSKSHRPTAIARERSSYTYKLFRVRTHDGKSTTVSVDPALVQKACDLLGGTRPVGAAIRSYSIAYQPGTAGMSRSRYVSRRLLDTIADASSRPYCHSPIKMGGSTLDSLICTPVRCPAQSSARRSKMLSVTSR